MLPYVYEYRLFKPLPYGFQRQKSPTGCRKLRYLPPFQPSQSYQPTVQGDAWIIRLSISLLVVGIFILTMWITKRLFPLVILYCTDRRNFRNMNIMEKIRQKYTGFISQASNVKNILRQYGFPDKERVFQVGYL